ncbi:unnamed protein product [Cylicocyclus nassatus]|uniref:Uncharacterized protein n=1 Tax=Cylicocyclus nassatus TaxID=53992 RepID=A0AA36GDN9_CYLNA|nr:unnamed protein product [Cylicocyclus nassatus]
MCCHFLFQTQKICLVVSILMYVSDCVVFVLLSLIFGSILAITDAFVLCLTLVSIVTMQRLLITLSLLGNTILRVPIIVALIRTVVIAALGYVYFLTIIFSPLAIVFYACLCLQLQKLRRLSTTGVRVTVQRVPQQQFVSTATVPITFTTASSPQASTPAYFGRPPPPYPTAPPI